MPRRFKSEQEQEEELVQMLQNSGWNVVRQPRFLSHADLLIEKDNLKYVVELKRAAESRRDRVVPLLAEAILQAQAYSQGVPQARPLAVIASPRISQAVIHQAIQFQQEYAPDIAVGFFDNHGSRFFRAPGLESLNSPPPEVERWGPLPEFKPYSIFSDLGKWMLKVILAQKIEPKYLCAPRQKISNASELAVAAAVSQVSASRLVRQLDVEGFLDRNSNELNLARLQDLFEEWQAAERRAFKEIPCRWVIPGHGGKRLESALREYVASQSGAVWPKNQESRSARVCLGLFAAAEALGLGFVHGVPPVLYVERIDQNLVQQLGISRERPSQPDVYLRIPAHKESIFRAAVEQKGIPASDALQVWLDVSNHPWRGKEQADQIRQKVLGPLLERE